LFFSKGDCKYCKEFAPILKDFSDTYSFVTEEISIDGKMTKLFNGKKMPNLARSLGIEATPTIVAVRKDGKKAFEMIRGYVTISELEEYAELAKNYAENIR
jgi:thioredoxin-related protein